MFRTRVDMDIAKKLENKKYVVYGTGLYASVLYAYLDINEITDSLEYFVVSNKTNDSFMDKPVKEYNTVKDELNEYITIVAIKKADSILEELKQHVDNIIHINEVEYNNIKKAIYDSVSDKPIKQNQIFFDCFEGSNYKCNSKYIAEKLIENNVDCEMVWNLNDMSSQLPNKIKKVRRYTKDYYEAIYTSKIIIENDGVEGTPYKRDGQFRINTWHGTGPFKKVNASMDVTEERRNQIKSDYSLVDLMISNSEDNSMMYREAFLYDGEILECGNPRIDYLYRDVDIQNLRSKIGIPEGKKVLLYAPTFRDSGEKSFEWFDIDMNRVVKALNSRFGGEFILLYRFHHQLYKYSNRCNNYYSEGINVTYYTDVMELLKVTDVLITDYSAIMWDFSLQGRPVFLYQNDEKEYDNDRGFYWPVSEWAYAAAHTNDELIKIIEEHDEDDYQLRLAEFFRKDPSYDRGNASQVIVERIVEAMNN